MNKRCSKCKGWKNYSEFFKDSRKGMGVRSRCKICCKEDTMAWRERNKSYYNNYTAEWRAKNPSRQHATEIKRNYGLSIERYNEMLTAQSCQCKICGKQHDPSLKRGRLYVDHCHKTGIVRALLCGSCNSAIGHLNDDLSLLDKASAYLKSYL